jgi:hypothetical protein
VSYDAEMGPILPAPHGQRSGALGLFAGAAFVGLFAAPALGPGLSELAVVSAVVLVVVGAREWQRNRPRDARAVVAELDRQRRQGGGPPVR